PKADEEMTQRLSELLLMPVAADGAIETFRIFSPPAWRRLSTGKRAAPGLPRCDTEAMNLHLAEIATEIAPGKHAVLLLNQAGWHLSNRLVVPATITLMPLPPKCPELNPVENVWQFIRENWLSNRVFPSYDNLL